MKRTVLLTLAVLFATSCVIPSAKAIDDVAIAAIAFAATGPAIYGAYKLGKLIKRSKTAQTIAKGVGAIASGCVAISAGTEGARLVNRIPQVNPWAIFAHWIFSGLVGLSGCMLAESAYNDIKTEKTN